MSFADHIKDMGVRTALAKRLNTVPEYLYQIAAGHRKAGPALAMRIEEPTGISRSELRPDIWPPERRRPAARA